ncbi:MAG TPA: ABC transporter ATP-binding protein [Gammaproteobacteria bacterium]|nr:ABC transporter ATP-binding protein [Gammaproteobacteria bacterium]
MIQLDRLCKSYLTLRGRKTVFRDLSLDLPDANIGLIGRNGAGKSTLMRLLSAVEMPDSGRIMTSVSLSWPVGLMGGMQQNLTGRENVKFVCRIHGIRGEEMRRRIEYVRDFAEIGDYFDLPISTYSAGMRARVGFGTSMAFDFDYYLIDEILAVGDATFKKKSRALFAEKLKVARVVLVSHNMNLIRKMCGVVVHLDDGVASLYDDVDEGIGAYQQAGQAA